MLRPPPGACCGARDLTILLLLQNSLYFFVSSIRIILYSLPLLGSAPNISRVFVLDPVSVPIRIVATDDPGPIDGQLHGDVRLGIARLAECKNSQRQPFLVVRYGRIGARGR